MIMHSEKKVYVHNARTKREEEEEHDEEETKKMQAKKCIMPMLPIGGCRVALCITKKNSKRLFFTQTSVAFVRTEGERQKEIENLCSRIFFLRLLFLTHLIIFIFRQQQNV